MCDHCSFSPVADVCVAGHRNDCRSVWDQIIVSIIWNLLRLPLDWIKWPSGSSSLHGLMRSWWSSSPATNTKLSLLPAPTPRLRTDRHSSILSSCASGCTFFHRQLFFSCAWKSQRTFHSSEIYQINIFCCPKFGTGLAKGRTWNRTRQTLATNLQRYLQLGLVLY